MERINNVHIAATLLAAVDEGLALFAGVPEERTARRGAGGKWSARQVIGHLIDSACNNHRRFVINQDDAVATLVVDPYDQNDWVHRNRYADTPAADLAALWAHYNRHIARVLAAVPDEVLNRPRGKFADYQLSYMTPPGTDDATLGHVAEDYVAHIHHHLKQIRALLTSV